LAIFDKEKASLFGEHFSNIFKPQTDIYPSTEHLERINSFINNPLPMSLPAKHTSPSEIKFLISKLKEKKAPGYDLITNKILIIKINNK